MVCLVQESNYSFPKTAHSRKKTFRIINTNVNFPLSSRLTHFQLPSIPKIISYRNMSNELATRFSLFSDTNDENDGL